MRYALLAVTGTLALLAAACGSGSSSPHATPVASAPAATPTLAPDDAPMPEHLTFAPGETIAADGKAGVFFLDPKTGAAEAWVVPAVHVSGQPETADQPFTFSVGGMSADGNSLVYTCRQPPVGSGPLVPCGGAEHGVWYLFDTRTGARRRLPTLDGDPYASPVSISPDGSRLLGLSGGKLFLYDAAGAADPRAVAVQPGVMTDVRTTWSPDSSRALVYTVTGDSAYIVRADDGRATPVLHGASAAWAPDGSRLAILTETASAAAIVVVDRDGNTAWSKQLRSLASAPAWSADGALLYVYERDFGQTAAEPNPPDRGEVLDRSTGKTLLGVKGTLCPEGWVGSTHRFVAATYGFGEIVLDADAATYTTLPTYAHPAPFDDSTVYAFDGNDFRAIDIGTGTSRLIAHTTVFPAWDPNDPMFAGDRIFFTPLHGGHGGCGEGSGPAVNPSIEVQRGPFPDDPPVIRGE